MKPFYWNVPSPDQSMTIWSLGVAILEFFSMSNRMANEITKKIKVKRPKNLPGKLSCEKSVYHQQFSIMHCIN